MADTKIMNCPSCVKHDYQDGKYGNKVRVFNLGETAGGSRPATCTVCGSTKRI